MAYKVSYDPGNAAYASYMRYLIQDSDILRRIFQHSSPNDEILGDGMEIALAVASIATRFPAYFAE